MTDEQITRLLAEKLMEAKPLGPMGITKTPAYQFCDGSIRYLSGPASRCWRPLESLDDAREAEMRLKEAGTEKWAAYGYGMWLRLTVKSKEGTSGDEGIADIAATDARTRCIALLKAVGVEVSE